MLLEKNRKNDKNPRNRSCKRRKEFSHLSARVPQAIHASVSIQQRYSMQRYLWKGDFTICGDVTL